LRPEEIMAYADGELPAEEAARVERDLEQDPAAMALLGEYFRQRLLLAAVCREVSTGSDGRALHPAELATVSRRLVSDQHSPAARRNLPASGPVSKRRAVWLAFAASLALLVGISYLVSLRGERLQASIASPHGEVVIQRGNQTLRPQEISGLRIGDVIKTGPGGAATLKYLHEATSLDLKENTEIRLSGIKSGKQIELTRGKLEAGVAKQPAGRPMILYTPQAKATVVGTRFVLDARRTSTWLEMTEGIVDLARNTEAGAPRTEDSGIKVEAGQYAVVARGLELVARPVTREANPARPAPVKVDLFSFFDEGASWLVSAEEIRQTKVASTLRPFKTPRLDGHLVFEADVQVDELMPRKEDWGFALQVRFGKGWPSNQVIRLRGVNGVEFALMDSISKRSQTVPYAWGRGRKLHVKLQVNPEPGKGITHVSGKVWEGDQEPETWSVQMDAPFNGPLYDIALETIHSACTFTRLKSGLIE
jgi:ferric-dicitrate binding protein FerR (iron transport regulator)